MKQFSDAIKSKMTVVPETCKECYHIKHLHSNCTATIAGDGVFIPGDLCVYRKILELEQLVLELTPDFILTEMEE